MSDPSANTKCDCGKEGTILCSDIADALGLPLSRCTKPICAHGGEWSECGKHRHQEGTMGYMTNTELRCEFSGFAPEDDSLFERMSAWWRNTFWSPARQVQHAYDSDVEKYVTVPTPFPKVKMFHKKSGRVFKSNSTGLMVETAER